MAFLKVARARCARGRLVDSFLVFLSCGRLIAARKIVDGENFSNSPNVCTVLSLWDVYNLSQHQLVTYKALLVWGMECDLNRVYGAMLVRPPLSLHKDLRLRH